MLFSGKDNFITKEGSAKPALRFLLVYLVGTRSIYPFFMLRLCRETGRERIMGKFDIVLWDVDQTLLDFSLSQKDALNASFKQYGREIEENVLSLYTKINDAYWKQYELGKITKEELLTGRFASLFAKLGIRDISIEAFASCYQKRLGETYYFRDNAYELCVKLKGRVRQYVVTNGVSATQRNKLHLSGLDLVLDGIFVSEEMGAPKPAFQYFEKCFGQIPGFQQEKTLIVGDSLSSDMQGGNNAGIACCWYNPEQKVNETDIRIDYEITNLWELEGIL